VTEIRLLYAKAAVDAAFAPSGKGMTQQKRTSHSLCRKATFIGWSTSF